MDNNYSSVPPIGGKKMCQLKDFSSYFFFRKTFWGDFTYPGGLQTHLAFFNKRQKRKGTWNVSWAAPTRQPRILTTDPKEGRVDGGLTKHPFLESL